MVNSGKIIPLSEITIAGVGLSWRLKRMTSCQC